MSKPQSYPMVPSNGGNVLCLQALCTVTLLAGRRRSTGRYSVGGGTDFVDCYLLMHHILCPSK